MKARGGALNGPGPAIVDGMLYVNSSYGQFGTVALKFLSSETAGEDNAKARPIREGLAAATICPEALGAGLNHVGLAIVPRQQLIRLRVVDKLRPGPQRQHSPHATADIRQVTHCRAQVGNPDFVVQVLVVP